MTGRAWRGQTCVRRSRKKIKLKIKNNVKKVKKVLQNGYKYPQNSSTLLFSINFIDLNALIALKFPKIVKNYYGAPPPPGGGGLLTNTFLSFISSSYIVFRLKNLNLDFVELFILLLTKSFAKSFTKWFTKTFTEWFLLHILILILNFIIVDRILDIHLNDLNALQFPKIVKNYYGAPPPPEPTTCQNSFFNLSQGRNNNVLIAYIVYIVIIVYKLIFERFVHGMGYKNVFIGNIVYTMVIKDAYIGNIVYKLFVERFVYRMVY